jgi:hypothetical protein
MDPLDVALDHELRTLLAAEPSPDFIARTRARIAAEPAASWWQWSWTFAMVAAVFVAAIAAAAIARFGVAPVSVPADGPLLAARTIVEASGALVVPFVPRRMARLRPGTTAAAVVVSGFSRTSEPEVLIDPREARALRRLLNGIRQHKIDPSLLPDFPDLTAHALDDNGPIFEGERQ